MQSFIRELNRDELAIFRRIEKQNIKLKAVLDRIFFLNECEVFGIIPKCVRLKRTFTLMAPLSQSQGRILPLDLLNLIIVMYFVFLEQCVVTMLTVIVKETFTASKIVSLIMQLRLRRCNHL